MGPQADRVAPVATPPASVPAQAKSRPYSAIGSYLLRLILGAGLLTFVLSRINRHQLVHLLSQERPGFFLAATTLYIGGQMVAAGRWRLLARLVGITGRYLDFLLYFFIGAFTNLFVPGVVGGDAARALYLARRHHEVGKAVASVIADRLVGLLVLVWLAVACIFALGSGILPPAITTPVCILGGLSVLGYLVMPIVTRIKQFLPVRLDSAVTMLAPYLRGRWAMMPALGMSLGLHLIQVIAQYILGLGLGLKLPFWLFLLCVPTTNVFASLPLTFNGLGLREGIYVVMFGLAGVGQADATALGLLWFAITTVAGLCASIAFFLAPTPLEKQA